MQQAMIDELKRQEALFLYVYDDATNEKVEPGYTCKGNPTIGWGRCLNTKGITTAEAVWLLNNDISYFEGELKKTAFWPSLNVVRQDVLTNMAFNMGMAGLLTFHKMIACIEAKDFAGAAREALDSPWRYEVGQRAVLLAKQLETGTIT